MAAVVAIGGTIGIARVVAVAVPKVLCILVVAVAIVIIIMMMITGIRLAYVDIVLR